MAAQLWMLRHGEAVPHDSKPDHDRELTPRGRAQSEPAGRALAALGVEFSACYASPKVRAWETATLACQALNVRPGARGRAGQRLQPPRRAHAAGRARRRTSSSSATSRSFSQVVYDFTGARVDFKKGGVVALEAARTAGSCSSLLRPRELEAIAPRVNGPGPLGSSAARMTASATSARVCSDASQHELLGVVRLAAARAEAVDRERDGGGEVARVATRRRGPRARSGGRAARSRAPAAGPWPPRPACRASGGSAPPPGARRCARRGCGPARPRSRRGRPRARRSRARRGRGRR